MNRFLDNVPIARKVMLALALMTASALGAAWFAVASLSATDARYSALLEREAKAATWMARTNSSIIDAGRLLNRMIAEPEAEQMRAIQREMQGVRRQVNERLAEAAKVLPSIARDAEAVGSAFRRAVETAAEAEAATLVDDNARALRVMAERYDPAAMEARRLSLELIERVDSMAQRASDDATADTNVAWWTTLAASVLGAAISVGLALWMVQSSVSRPIGRIAERMRLLAGGEKESPVPGAGRRDEVGQMAEAVEGFRLAAIEQERMATANAAEAAAKLARAERV
ncbi:HAMP domain-containing protein, partial [Muricoccus pecuniae]